MYLYLFNYKNPDDIYVIKDFQGNTEPSYEKVATPSKPQYNSSSAAIDEEGSIYFKNDSGYLFKFINKVNGAFGVEDVIDIINRLPNIENITLNDEISINDVMERYKDLSDEDKLMVTNIDKLNSALEKINDLKDADKEVERLLVEIKELPDEITLEDKAKVKELFDSYDKLSEEHKLKVTNADKLINSYKTIIKLEEAEAIKDMEAKIAKLPELKDIVLDEEEKINNLYKEFTNLSEDVQNQVTNKDKLIEAKEKIDYVRGEVTSIEKDIWEKINPENITLENKDIVYGLISRYNALDERDRKYVNHFDEVLDAKKVIDTLEKAEEKVDVKPEVKPETKPEVKSEVNTQTNLPKTGGVNSVILIFISAIILTTGTILFLKNNNLRKEIKK
ncbi:LPXTG cell wall anchor domain-containing protein [Clostridium sp. 29_15]|uniref:LPXTG cell wall anchor domain-containing protein n=1 Tax=Clostridium sp. 29_15 TaxID=1896982 RepID=UPI000959704A|nr:LPXTG cell wall anchor domain-containing protein [Clostridium sp. 29_15]OKZ86550.1 MAG: hypothetical protein BHW04_07050 [Clostridium sp. 29_15]